MPASRAATLIVSLTTAMACSVIQAWVRRKSSIMSRMAATLPAKDCSSSSGAFGWKLVSQCDSVWKAKVGVTRFDALQVIDGRNPVSLG
jgi:hypothetical protein